jgi:hypothetical protein
VLDPDLPAFPTRARAPCHLVQRQGHQSGCRATCSIRRPPGQWRQTWHPRGGDCARHTQCRPAGRPALRRRATNAPNVTTSTLRVKRSPYPSLVQTARGQTLLSSSPEWQRVATSSPSATPLSGPCQLDLNGICCRDQFRGLRTSRWISRFSVPHWPAPSRGANGHLLPHPSAESRHSSRVISFLVVGFRSARNISMSAAIFENDRSHHGHQCR